jgi:alanyl-tRNA synthetase
MAQEKGWTVDMDGFNDGLNAQKERSRKAAEVDTMDWVVLKPGGDTIAFVGYETLEAEVEVVKYRKVKTKKDDFYEIVLDKTPFYAESGGQVGDKGVFEKDGTLIGVLDTYKENELSIHKTLEIFDDMSGTVKARVDSSKRLATVNNHSATHLMHAALRTVLGDHVEQRGSLVDEERLRFDFSHFSRMTEEEIRRVEEIVNAKIRENIPIEEKRDVPFNEAVSMGAMALFGEKYGDQVRVITFDPRYSVELCGGTHVKATGQIGLFKIVSEGAIAAGIRRVEAVTGKIAEEYVYGEEDLIRQLKESMKNTKDLVKGVHRLIEENKELQKKLDSLGRDIAKQKKSEFLDSAEQIGEVRLITGKIDGDAKAAKDLAFSMKDDGDDLVILLGNASSGKAGLTLMIAEPLIREKDLHAGNMIRELAKEIQGGGGGQPHFASAGGKDPSGFDRAFEKAREILKNS